jgi:putative SOS response-associated peptidase YedK
MKDNFMCGRFENNISPYPVVEQLKFHFPDIDFEIDEEETRKVNIAPTNKILTLTNTENKFKFTPMFWGIKFSDDSPLLFNSRIETIKEKKYWKNLFNKNRCLVPMTAFYEWKKEGTRKAPYRIYLPEEKLFFVPALYLLKDEEYYTSLITTTPNAFIKKIHHRMPVIFKIQDVLKYFYDDEEINLHKCIPLSDKIKMGMERAEI